MNTTASFSEGAAFYLNKTKDHMDRIKLQYLRNCQGKKYEKCEMMSNDIVEKINNYDWSDCSIYKLEIDYETIIISISLSTDNILKLHCKDYIGYSFIGHWDESIIEKVIIDDSGTLINESLQEVKKRYGETPLLGGGTKKIDDNWYQLNIKLIDGNTLKVVCKDFATE